MARLLIREIRYSARMRDSILHLADLHLGAPVAARLDELLPTAHAKLERSRNTFLIRLADWVAAPENRVGLVLLAGDRFQHHPPTEQLANTARLARGRIATVVPV